MCTVTSEMEQIQTQKGIYLVGAHRALLALQQGHQFPLYLKERAVVTEFKVKRVSGSSIPFPCCSV